MFLYLHIIGIVLDNDLHFEPYLKNICKKTDQKVMQSQEKQYQQRPVSQRKCLSPSSTLSSFPGF